LGDEEPIQGTSHHKNGIVEHSHTSGKPNRHHQDLSKSIFIKLSMNTHLANFPVLTPPQRSHVAAHDVVEKLKMFDEIIIKTNTVVMSASRKKALTKTACALSLSLSLTHTHVCVCVCVCVCVLLLLLLLLWLLWLLLVVVVVGCCCVWRNEPH